MVSVIGITLLAVLVLGFNGAPFWLWSLVALGSAYALHAPCGVWIALGVIAVIGSIRPIRALLLTRAIMAVFRGLKILPKISETEREAIEAGNVWIEGELFSGKPNFKKIFGQPSPKPTADEQAFMDGPLERLCDMIDDWKIWQDRKLPDDLWNFIRREKFLGMIIPKEYGGLGFTPLGHSEVIRRIASRSTAVATYVMVPNSLGPAELLIHYGTDEQKKHYLPKLANGEDIPCFALTEPLAGSDAGAISAEGILFKGADGKLQIRLNWNKRWITLASISTVLGLAFRLKDPEHLLGAGPDGKGAEDLGITCALIPTKTPGVVVGLRHDPLGVPFHNCPTQGKDVVVPADAVIGGLKNAGKGWGMLMESLASGRGVSFPAQSAGGCQMVLRATTGHAIVRQQFGISIGKFEGIHDPLSKIAGLTYLLESLRLFTLSALNQNLKPGIVTAISKYYSTELGRQVVNHGMDILGGQGISLGPKNLLGHLYIATPISVTVEGANILTRTLMIFGQGALRAHPYAYAEIKAMGANDVGAFDRAFWGHIGHVVRNLFRSVLLSVTRGWLTLSRPGGSATAKYYRRLNWASASFAILADLAMGALGGKLKRKENLTGRFGDVLAYMYMGSAILHRFEAEGAKKEDLPVLRYSMKFVFKEIQNAFDGILANLPVPMLGWLFRGPIRLWSKINAMGSDPSDHYVSALSELVLTDVAARDRLTHGMYLPKDPSQQFARLEQAVALYRKAHDPSKKTQNAADVAQWDTVRRDIVQVDSFSEDEYHGRA